MSSSLQLHGLQHTRIPCPSLSSRVCSSSCPLSRWCYLTISSSVALFSLCFQSFPASGSFPMSWLFTSGSQSIGDAASASVLPMNIQGWLPLGMTDWFHLFAVQGTLKSLLQHHNLKASILWNRGSQMEIPALIPRVAARTEPALLLHRPGLKQRMLWTNCSAAAFGLAVFL